MLTLPVSDSRIPSLLTVPATRLRLPVVAVVCAAALLSIFPAVRVPDCADTLPVVVNVVLAVNSTEPMSPDEATTFDTDNEPLVATRSKVEFVPADELLSVMLPLSEAVMSTLPVELAVMVVALVSAIKIPPVPAVATNVGVVMAPVVIVPAPPGVADNVSEPVATAGAVSVMFPLVEDKLMFGETILLNAVSVSELNAVTLTSPAAPAPVAVAPRVTLPPAEVKLTVLALTVAAVVKSVADSRLIVPSVPLAASTFPATCRASFFAFTVKVEPFPPDDVLSVTFAEAVSTTSTLPVELADRVVASVFDTVMPPVPLVSVRSGALINAAVETDPAPVGVALNDIDFDAVNDPLRATFPAVDERLRFGADKFESPVSVIVLDAVTLICPLVGSQLVTAALMPTPALLELRLMIPP